MRRSPVWIGFALSLLTACGGIASAPKGDGGTDAGSSFDAGPVDGGQPDAGERFDAGEDAGVDAGDAVDAGVDAGAEEDGGVETDAGIDAGIDGGSIDEDAGTDGGIVVVDAGLDGGLGVDGGFEVDGGPADAGVEEAAARQSLEDIADAYRAFYAAELRWPNADSYWDPRTLQVSPTIAGPVDTSLFTAPWNLRACGPNVRGPCWEGPFLSAGTALGQDPWLDPWGQPIRYALFGPTSGLANAPQGAIVLWSVGADGIDQAGCMSTESADSCTLDPEQLVLGLPSVQGADDVIVVISPAFDPVSSTQLLLRALGDAFLEFHTDTGLWPWACCGWNPIDGLSPEISPFSFTWVDTVLASAPTADQCGAGGLFLPPNWAGPYVWSDVQDLGSGPALDGWGNPLMFALIRPLDGNGGGVESAPDGAILIWSTGPDGIDQTGCVTGACAINYLKLVKAQPSVDSADDIGLYVGPAVEPMPN